MNLQGLSTIHESTKITMIFIYPRPKAMKGETLVIKDTKPDIDNLVKTVMDALTGATIINDDNIITSINATKYYGPRDYAGQTEITIETPYRGDNE